LHPRRLAPDRLRIAKSGFEKMLRNGSVRPSDSPWASPRHLLPKKVDGWRPCGDYRALNGGTVPYQCPFRHIADFAQLAGRRVFTMDLVKACNQIPVHPHDIPKTAIISPFGGLEFPYMSFGFRKAAKTFQRFIDDVLHACVPRRISTSSICVYCFSDSSTASCLIRPSVFLA
jgi:hypothetical protein